MPSRSAASSMFDSPAQICCGLPKPRKAVDGTVCDRMLRATMRAAGDHVRPDRGVGALADHAVRDVRVRADEVVGLDVPEQHRAVGPEPGPDADLGRRPADGLERLLEAQHEADGPAGLAGHEREQRLVLRVLLAAEPAARVGREHAHLGQRQPEHRGDDALEPVGVLDRAPDRHAVAVGRRHERVRLDRELRDHREGVGAVDDDRGIALGGLEVAPAEAVLAQDVGAGEGVVGPDRRVLDERRRRVQRGRDRADRGQRLELDADERGRLLGERRGSRRRRPRPGRRGTSSRRPPAPGGRAAGARSAASATAGRRGS